MKELKLIPPTDPRVQSAIAPFNNEMLKDEGFKDRKELSEKMFDLMKKYGGIGLSANQVGLPFNMFVIGGHPSIEKGLKMTCFNPMIVSTGEENIRMKEGCLTYPFLFLNIKRPRKIVAKFEDENGEMKEGSFDGYMSRVFQHEYDHTQGITMVDKVSKFRYNLGLKKAQKIMKKHMREMKNAKKDN